MGPLRLDWRNSVQPLMRSRALDSIHSDGGNTTSPIQSHNIAPRLVKPPALTSCAHSSIRGVIARPQCQRVSVVQQRTLEGVQGSAALEKVGHGDVPGLHARSVHRGGHLPVPVAALLPDHRHPHLPRSATHPAVTSCLPGSGRLISMLPAVM